MTEVNRRCPAGAAVFRWGTRLIQCQGRVVGGSCTGRRNTRVRPGYQALLLTYRVQLSGPGALGCLENRVENVGFPVSPSPGESGPRVTPDDRPSGCGGGNGCDSHDSAAASAAEMLEMPGQGPGSSVTVCDFSVPPGPCCAHVGCEQGCSSLAFRNRGAAECRVLG